MEDLSVADEPATNGNGHFENDEVEADAMEE